MGLYLGDLLAGLVGVLDGAGEVQVHDVVVVVRHVRLAALHAQLACTHTQRSHPSRQSVHRLYRDFIHPERHEA